MHPDRIPPHGDEADLFRRYNAELVGSLMHRLNVSREVAEDAAQIAWTQLYRLQPDRETVMGWLYTVAKHEVFAILRRAKREPMPEVLPEPGDLCAIEDPIAAKDALQLLARLKPQQREVLGLLAEGYSYKETCAITGHTYTWVNRHATEGRAALRNLLGEDG